MNRTSRLRFEITALVSVCGRSASFGAHADATAAMTATAARTKLSSCAQR